jgi:uncharacterized membrane protein YkoI
MKQTSFILVIVISMLFATFSVNSKDALKATTANKQCQLISNKTAMTRAQKKIGGKVVSIKLDKKGKDSIYRVRVLVGGKRIKNITIKACK